jgi:hypothetical protein
MRRAVLALACLTLVACGTSDPADTAARPPAATPEPQPSISACEQAVADAADVDAASDSHEDVWPAFDACATREEFAAAVEQAGGQRFDGVDPAVYVDNQCAYEPAVKGTQLCS